MNLIRKYGYLDPERKVEKLEDEKSENSFRAKIVRYRSSKINKQLKFN